MKLWKKDSLTCQNFRTSFLTLKQREGAQSKLCRHKYYQKRQFTTSSSALAPCCKALTPARWPISILKKLGCDNLVTRQYSHPLYHVLTTLWPACNNLVTTWHKVVARLVQGCCMVGTRLWQGCDKVVTTLLDGCLDPGIVMPASQFLVATRWSQGCK